VAVRRASKHDLNMLADNRPHQGLLLDCSPLDWIPLDRLPDAPGAAPAAAGAGEAEEGEEAGRADAEGGAAGGGEAAAAGGRGRHPVWLALDEVVDPVGVISAV
jgi:hypothetical protein